MYKYKKAAVGGTFDRLHNGHRSLVQLAFEVAEQVVVGVTVDEFVKDKELAKVILPYPTRVVELQNFVRRMGGENRFGLSELRDVYGVTLSDPEIDVLVVSEMTLPGSRMVNQERKRLGLGELPIEVVEMVRDISGDYISSTRIRRGEVSISGMVYARLFEKDILLSEPQKQLLKVPMGRLVREKELGDLLRVGYTMVAVVGDKSVETFVRQGLGFDVGVVDGHTHRDKLVEHNLGDEYIRKKAKNRAGMIEEGAVKVLRESLGQKVLVEVEGEEDLMVLPLLLFMPLGSVIVYGQPGEGLVMVSVDEMNKNRWYSFLRGEW